MKQQLVRIGLGTMLAATAALTPAVASATVTPPVRSGATASCTGPVMTAVKAKLHTAATEREATLTQLSARLTPVPDSFGLNAGQLAALQDANSGIQGLDETIQATCYTTVADLRAAGAQLFEGYRVYWLRIPQTRQLEAVGRLGDLSAKVSDAATKLAARVGDNTKAQSDLAAMNAQIAVAAEQLGTTPSASAPVTATAGLVPAKDMTANVDTMHTSLDVLRKARTALEQARIEGLKVVHDLHG